MDLSGHISDLITVAQQLRNNPSSDKKALNKTIARLEEAQLWSEKVVSGRVQGVPVGTNKIEGTETPTTKPCICPEGAIDATCPTHGTN